MFWKVFFFCLLYFASKILIEFSIGLARPPIFKSINWVFHFELDNVLEAFVKAFGNDLRAGQEASVFKFPQTTKLHHSISPAERKWVLTFWWRLQGILTAPR